MTYLVKTFIKTFYEMYKLCIFLNFDVLDEHFIVEENDLLYTGTTQNNYKIKPWDDVFVDDKLENSKQIYIQIINSEVI